MYIVNHATGKVLDILDTYITEKAQFKDRKVELCLKSINLPKYLVLSVVMLCGKPIWTLEHLL